MYGTKGHITQRADNFARKIAPAKTPPDMRSVDEKMAEFHAKWEPERVKSARRAVKDV